MKNAQLCVVCLQGLVHLWRGLCSEDRDKICVVEGPAARPCTEMGMPSDMDAA